MRTFLPSTLISGREKSIGTLRSFARKKEGVEKVASCEPKEEKKRVSLYDDVFT